MKTLPSFCFSGARLFKFDMPIDLHLARGHFRFPLNRLPLDKYTEQYKEIKLFQEQLGRRKRVYLEGDWYFRQLLVEIRVAQTFAEHGTGRESYRSLARILTGMPRWSHVEEIIKGVKERVQKRTPIQTETKRSKLQ